MGCLHNYLRRPELLVPLMVLLVWIFWWFLVKPLSYWKKRGIPAIPAVPWMGSMPVFFWRKYIGDVFASMYAQLDGKKYGGFHKLSKPCILVRDPDLIKDILETNFSNFHDNDNEVPAIMNAAYSQNLGFLKGEAWDRLRGNLKDAYSTGNIKNFIPFILEVCETLEDCVSTKVDSLMELKEMGECYTTDVISSIAFGTRGDALLNPSCKFRRMGSKISRAQASRCLAVNMPWLLKIMPFLCSSRKAVDYFRDMVKESIHQREEEKVQRPDFLHVLVELQRKGKLRINEEAMGGEKDSPSKEENEGSPMELDNEALDSITAQALSFFINGLHTTANLISFSLLELAHNGDIQSRARAEVGKALERHGSMSQDTLMAMPYLDSILLETARKYPPSPFLARLASKKYYLPSPEYENEKGGEGIWLDEGSAVVIPILGLHRDPEYYPSPEIFDPDNFSDKNSSKRTQFTFLGFGGGPRTCIGMHLGLLLAKAAIATLLAKYDFLPSDKSSLPVALDPANHTTTAQGGLWVKVSSLKKKY
ncbi:probable cytochrome P450 6a13 [Hetaerina americana]|uniref:probable cytochrome P450 6a13 n=1 Tax=Hetaerina americana TaxID=62018 RepID=UPI003A7F16A4